MILTRQSHGGNHSHYRRDTQRNPSYMNQQDNNTELHVTSYHDSKNSANLCENNEHVEVIQTLTFHPSVPHLKV